MMADVISSPRGPTSVDEPQLRNNAVGRTRRRKTTDEVIEEMDSLEPYDRRAEDRNPADDAADEQREKELKKDSGECSPSYRYGDDDTVAPLSCNRDAIVPIETDPLVQVVQVVASADVMMEPQPLGSAIPAVERCDDGVEQSVVAEGQPVAPVVEAELSEQLRNLSPPAGANGDSLIVVEHAAAIINLHSGGYPLPEPTESPPPLPMMPPPMVNETERSETDQQPPVALLDTSRHSWHCCDNETHPINLTTDDLELSAIFTSNAANGTASICPASKPGSRTSRARRSTCTARGCSCRPTRSGCRRTIAIFLFRTETKPNA